MNQMLIGIIIVLGLGGFYLYQQNQVLSANNLALEGAVEEQKATMNARMDETGNRVTEGAQVDIGHHYVAMSRKEFQLDEVSPVAQSLPKQ